MGVFFAWVGGIATALVTQWLIRRVFDREHLRVRFGYTCFAPDYDDVMVLRVLNTGDVPVVVESAGFGLFESRRPFGLGRFETRLVVGRLQTGLPPAFPIRLLRHEQLILLAMPSEAVGAISAALAERLPPQTLADSPKACVRGLVKSNTGRRWLTRLVEVSGLPEAFYRRLEIDNL